MRQTELHFAHVARRYYGTVFAVAATQQVVHVTPNPPKQLGRLVVVHQLHGFGPRGRFSLFAAATGNVAVLQRNRQGLVGDGQLEFLSIRCRCFK